MAASTLKVKDVPLKGGGFEWEAIGKDHWGGKVPDGKLPPRIKQLDTKTFCCYRDGRYLGSESSMALAFERIKSNHLSDKNVALAIWQKAHPEELPPAMALTDAERAEWWRHNPPKGGRVAAPAASRGVAKVAALDGDVLPPTGLVKVGGKVIGHSGTVSVPAPRKRGEGGNKDAEIKVLLLRGCTAQEVLRVTGWTAISMPAMAKKLGLKLRIEKDVKPFRYHGE